MAKSDYPALLNPGVHVLTLDAIHEVAVASFAHDLQRLALFHKLKSWVGELQAIGLRSTLWLDGSFLTEKPSPGDIDCVMWGPNWADPSSATSANFLAASRLLDHSTAKTLYGLDLYVEIPMADEVVHREAYWKGFLGFCHDRVTAKGFAEVHL